MVKKNVRPANERNLSLLRTSTIGRNKGTTLAYAKRRDTASATPIDCKFKLKLVINSVPRPSCHNFPNASRVSPGVGRNTKDDEHQTPINNKTCVKIRSVPVDFDKVVFGLNMASKFFTDSILS